MRSSVSTSLLMTPGAAAREGQDATRTHTMRRCGTLKPSQTPTTTIRKAKQSIDKGWAFRMDLVAPSNSSVRPRPINRCRRASP